MAPARFRYNSRGCHASAWQLKTIRGQNMELLVIEDDPLIGKALRKGFSEAGHSCMWAKEGQRGLELATGQQFDAIILDLMLPGRPGLEVLKELRSLGILTPVIALTAL